VIGFLGGGLLAERRPLLVAFRQGLAEAGYVERQNVAIEYLWAEGQYDRLPALAADLVRRQVTVLVAGDGPSALAAKAAATTIPTVFSPGIEPVQAGLVASLSRPGGNLTGFNLIAGPLPAKQLGLLHELVPAAKTMGMLINPNNANAERDAATVQEAARSIGLRVLVIRAVAESDFETVFATMTREGAGAPCAAPDVGTARIPPGRRAHQLRPQPCGRVSSNRRLHREDPQRRQARRPAGHAADDLRAG